MTLRLGFDISYYEGKTIVACNLTLAKQRGIEWASVRATLDETGKDSAFVNNYAAFHAADIKVMPYHYYYHRKDPIKQAQNYIASLTAVGYNLSDLPPLIDLENYGIYNTMYSGEDVQIRKWLDTVEAAFDRRPTIYSNVSGIKTLYDKLPRPTWLREYPLFIAYPSGIAPQVPLPYYPNDPMLIGWQFGMDNFDAQYYGFDPLVTKGCSLQYLY